MINTQNSSNNYGVSGSFKPNSQNVERAGNNGGIANPVYQSLFYPSFARETNPAPTG